jgi:1,2-phenylacetyl-CoA epoxidase catalytic subunit
MLYRKKNVRFEWINRKFWQDQQEMFDRINKICCTVQCRQEMQENGGRGSYTGHKKEMLCRT